MATVNNEPGFTQLDKLNVKEKLLINGVEVTTVLPSQEIILVANSTAATQEPSVVDTLLQVEFGPAQTTGIIDLAANGNFTAQVAGDYIFDLIFQFGRTGGAGESLLFGFSRLQGVQVGRTIYARLDDADIVIPNQDRNTVTMGVGEVLDFQIFRDSAGNNSGGLFQQTATTIPVAPAASASVIISRLIGVAP